jgi:L-arabinose transport system substrate-binding protein
MAEFTRPRTVPKVAAIAAVFALVFVACSGAGATPSPVAPSIAPPVVTPAPVPSTVASVAPATTEASVAPATTEASVAPSAGTGASTAPSGATGGKLFVAINKQADQQYFIDLQTSFVDTIGKLGGTAAKFDAKDQAPLGVSLVNDAISKGAVGIAITVPDQSTGPAVAKAAKDAGIPLVATDDPIKDADGNDVPFVGFDGTDMGTKVGVEAGKLLTDAKWTTDTSKKVGVLSVEKQDLSVCNLRTDAEKAEIQKAGVAAANVFPVAGDGATPGAQTASAPVITAHPEITNWIVMGCNDESVLGALNALAAAGAKPADIIGVGLGAYEACRPWLAKVDSGFKAALYISGVDVGAAAAQVLYDNVVNGKPIPAKTVAKTTIVDPTSFSTVFSAPSLANCK